MLKRCLILHNQREKMKIENTKVKIVQKNMFRQTVGAIVFFTDNNLVLDKKEVSFIRRIKVLAGGNKNKIKLAIRDVLKIVEEKKITSIAFSVLCSGNKSLSLEGLCRIVIGEISKHFEKHSFLGEIIFVLPDRKTCSTFKELVTGCIGYIQREKGIYPVPTVDIIIEFKEGIVLIKRKNPPYGWAIPGGFVEYGESLETAAKREAKEETNLSLKDLFQFHTYSKSGRDPRFHTVSTVFVAQGKGNPKARSDAQELKLFTMQNLPEKFAFDHGRIIKDYFLFKVKNPMKKIYST